MSPGSGGVGGAASFTGFNAPAPFNSAAPFNGPVTIFTPGPGVMGWTLTITPVMASRPVTGPSTAPVGQPVAGSSLTPVPGSNSSMSGV